MDQIITRIKGSHTAAHLVAIATIAVWGMTFISSKVLLRSFLPVEILFMRFLLGFVALCLLSPRNLALREPWHEWLFVGAGATGILAYYLLENVALLYTTASNASVIVSTAPLFIGIVAHLLGQEKAITPGFVIGFVVAITGIGLITFKDAGELSFGNLGDFMCLGAAAVWAIYSAIITYLGKCGYPNLAVTKRTFAWGVLLMIPALYLMGASPDHLAALADPVNLANIAFLGLGASAGCFVTWSFAIRRLGQSASGVYIYLTPVVTVIASVLILHETVTPTMLAGIALVMAGLFISSRK